MRNHLNLKILIHIFTIICLIMIIIIMRGENFVAHLDGLGGTPVCRGTSVAHHWNSVLLVRLWTEFTWLRIGSSGTLNLWVE
jgi:hypothetical protein